MAFGIDTDLLVLKELFQDYVDGLDTVIKEEYYEAPYVRAKDVLNSVLFFLTEKTIEHKELIREHDRAVFALMNAKRKLEEKNSLT